MKRLTLTLGLMLCILSTLIAKDRVIKQPSFTAWSTNNLEIEKIIISDTATVVYIKAFYTPKNWIKIAKGSMLKDNNEEIYPIRNGIGITLDKEFWMPESGEAEFQLVFPPLPNNITSVDFSEGNFNGAYKIWGIQLNDNPISLPKEATLPKINTKATLPEPMFTYGKAVLNGKLLDYCTGMSSIGYLNLISPFRTLNGGLEIQINKDGTFRTEVEVSTLSAAKFYIPGIGICDLYLSPGKELSMLINTREFTRQASRLHRNNKPYGEKVYYNGYLASILQELSRNKIETILSRDYNELRNIAKEENVDKFKDYILQKRENALKQINKSSSSPALKEILKTNVDLSSIEVLSMTNRFIINAHIVSNGLSKEKAREYFNKTKITIPDNYFDTFKNLPSINTPKILYTTTEISPLVNMDENFQNMLGLNKGIIADIRKASKICRFIYDFTPLTTEQKAELSTLPVSYAEMIRQMNNDLLEKIEINKMKTGFKINEVGEVSNENLFAAIISKYHGHTLLVDFWATWCGPCRIANKEMIPMKEELKDKDIVYLYITGETSPMATWQNMIPNIHGEHFRVTNEQWRYLMEKLDIKGVPTYFIVDREGNTTYKQTGYPGTDTMKTQLTKALDTK